MKWISTIALVALVAIGAGCSDQPAGNGANGEIPTFSLAWSEYPSWSVFGVAHEEGLINGKAGELGPIEKKWNVDIELNELDYDPCLQAYGTGECDAVCITNMDILSPSLGRKSVAILPTSTSDGADALLVTKSITDVKQLKDKKVYGLSQTVSEYCWARNLQLLGEQEADYTFSNMDPGAAAAAMQQKQDGIDAIVVWNPFVLDTLGKRDDVHVLFDSTKIPGEIIDMVVIGADSLAKPGGEAFAHAVIDTYYQLNSMIEDPATRDNTLVALGEKFSDLDLEMMKQVVVQTKFYKDADAGIGLYTGSALPGVMEKVVDFCVSHGIVNEKPTVVFGDGDANVRFDASFMQHVKDNK
jgi:NitT/TauT family transport system substrate-binding protein